MKLKIFVALIVIAATLGWAVSVSAQSASGWERAGGSFGGPNTYVIHQSSAQDSGKTWNTHAPTPVDGVLLRKVGTNIFDMSHRGWVDAEGEVFRQEKGFAILNTDLGQIALTNYSGEIVSGKKIAVAAFRNGIYKMDEMPLAIWDCGKPYIVTPEETAMANAMLAKEKEEAKAKAQIKAAEQKKKTMAAALKFNLDLANKGDGYGLTRMGERYRDGEGVEKNLILAKEYFEKAVDAGSPTAKDELSKLIQP